MSLRLALCLLLTCACFAAGARDVRQAGANGDGGTCPEQLSAAEDEVAARTVGKRDSAVPRARTVAPRGSDPQGVRPPRWHSFLPGMFR